MKAMVVLIIVSAPMLIGSPDRAAAVATSGNHQFISSISGDAAQMDFVFGTSGVTGTYTGTTLTSASIAPFNDPITVGLPFATTYLEPDPPADSEGIASTVFANGRITGTISLSEPVPAVLLHIVNLDGSTFTVGGTSTTGAPIMVVPSVRNDELEITGTTLNSTPKVADQVGCEEDGTGNNPQGGCGSVLLTAASGQIQSFTIDDQQIVSGDGFRWTLSIVTPCVAPTAFIVANGQLTSGTIPPSGPIGFAPVGAPTIQYNAMGYNPADGYLYAIEAGQGVVRIDPTTGLRFPLGETTPPVGGSISGTFSPDGTYYLVTQDNGQTTLSTVDVTAMTRSFITLSAPPNVADVTFGRGGFLWGANTNGIVRIDSATGQVTVFPLPAGMAGTGGFGGLFTYPNGDLGLVQNDPGTIFRLRISDASAANPTFTLVSTEPSPEPVAVTLDATSCLPAPNAICLGPPPASLPGYTAIVVQPGQDTIGTAGNDLIIGSALGERIVGLGGDDIVFGEGGNDKVSAGTGDDTVCGGPGNDELAGEDGHDVLSGDDGDDRLSGGLADDLLFGGPGSDRLSGDAGADDCTPGNDAGDVAAVPACERVT